MDGGVRSSSGRGAGHLQGSLAGQGTVVGVAGLGLIIALEKAYALSLCEKG